MRRMWWIISGLSIGIWLAACGSAQIGVETATQSVPETACLGFQSADMNADVTVVALPTQPVGRPENFNVIFKYGVDAKNVLNTYDNTFTKDMVIDPNITTTLVLSSQELDAIYQKMIEIDFFAYPNSFAVPTDPNGCTGAVTPASTYRFDVVAGDTRKTLVWGDYITNPDDQASKLRELIRLIKTLIQARDEYKQLPQPRGGYA